jgi:purine catabolism regulator
MSSVDGGEPSSLRALQAQNAALRQIVAIHDRLGALVLQGADVAAITRMLADLIGRRVVLMDELLQVVSASPFDGQHAGWAPREGYLRAVQATLARERRPLRVPPMADFGVDASCVLAPVAAGDAILGYVAILTEGDEGGREDLDLQIVQHAATVYALSMMRERMAADVARQLKDELLEGLLLGRTQDEQVARERAMRLGYNPDLCYRVLVVVASLLGADDGERAPEAMAQGRRLLESLAELCTRRAVGALATVRDEELVVLVPASGDGSVAELGRMLVQHAAALLPAWRATAGVGGACSTASAIARSYAQARRALETARRFGNQGEVVAFEELGVYRLLFHVSDVGELRGFTDQVLGPLIEYDQRHRGDLVRTLGVFLEHNGNVQATARRLNLHVNSVAYRVQRLEAISGLNLQDAEHRLLAHMALKIINRIN